MRIVSYRPYCIVLDFELNGGRGSRANGMGAAFGWLELKVHGLSKFIDLVYDSLVSSRVAGYDIEIVRIWSGDYFSAIHIISILNFRLQDFKERVECHYEQSWR